MSCAEVPDSQDEEEKELIPPDRNRPNRYRKSKVAVRLPLHWASKCPTKAAPIVLGCRQREVFWPIKGP